MKRSFFSSQGLRRACFPIFCWTTLLITGCGGDDSSPQPVVPKDEIYLVGDLHGKLGDPLEEALKDRLIPYKGQKTDRPIFVSIPEDDQLDLALKAALKASFEDGAVIALEHATDREINTLLEALGLEPSFRLNPDMPAEVRYVEIFAIHQQGGDTFTWVSYPDDQGIVRIITPTDDPLTGGGPMLTPETDKAFQSKRAGAFIDWVDDAKNHEIALARNKVTAKGEAAALPNAPNELTELAQANVQTSDASQYGMTFQITHTVYAFHSFTDPSSIDYDWFYVEERAMLNPSAIYKRTPGSGSKRAHVEGYVVNYKFESGWDWGVPPPLLTDASLVQSTPASANNVQTLTSGFSWNLGGSVGFNGKTPTGSISGGISVSSSSSVQVSDCETINQSASNVNNAKWFYQFRRPPDGKLHFSWRDLLDAPWLSRDNFQPINKWIWKLSPGFRNDPERNHFTSRFESTIGWSEGGDGVWWIVDKTRHEDWYGTFAIFFINLNYPPILMPDNRNISFNKGAAFKPVTVNVSRKWTGKCDQPWCTISPTGGNGNDGEIYVTVTANTTGAERTATVSLTTTDGKGKAEIKVYQSQT